MPKAFTIALTSISLAILTGCGTMTVSGAETDPAGREQLLFCDVAKPFRWSSRDSDDTIAQAKAFNAVGVALCGWQSPGA